MYALDLIFGEYPQRLEGIDEVAVARGALSRAHRAAARCRFTPARPAPGSSLWVGHAIKYATAFRCRLALRRSQQLLSNFRIAPAHRGITPCPPSPAPSR